MTKKMGRPTKYNEDILEKANQYFYDCIEQNKIPFVEDIAISLRICDKTIYNWANQHPEFLRTIQAIMVLQKKELKKRGLMKEVDTRMANLLLQADHGLKTTQVVEDNRPNETIDKLKQIHDELAKENT
jgi:GR25 family glycosyltransferase involved in LPS biosynthesis